MSSTEGAGRPTSPEVSSQDVAESVRAARGTIPQDDQEMLANGVLLELRRAASSLAEIRE